MHPSTPPSTPFATPLSTQPSPASTSPEPAAYAELWCLSNFSFLRGASHPHELVERAHALGYHALALTDIASLAGVVRAHEAAKACGLPLLMGAQFELDAVAGDTAAMTLIVLARSLRGYGNLCEFITRARRAAPKGSYRLTRAEVSAEALAECVFLAAPARTASAPALLATALWLRDLGDGSDAWLVATRLLAVDDERWLARLRDVAARAGLPLVAAGDVHMHRRARKPLQDVLTAIRVGRPLSECGYALQPNAERHLRSRERLAQLYPPDLLAQTLLVAQRCQFSLDELRYQYPEEVVPNGETPAAYLRRIAYQGAHRRWPQGLSDKVRGLIEHELALISDLRYEHYFLTVYDIVRYARERGILCQGRGSAANSAVCYCLGVTEVDPDRMSVLFERFISRERNEPPDIDIDFEHERREEVIQYLYQRYGRERAGLTAVVISYRRKSAVRDVGKALGLAPEVIEALAKDQHSWDGPALRIERLAQFGIAPHALIIQQFMTLTAELLGFPRHLSQHVGGFVLTREPLSRMVPIENAAMADRTVIEWDKDDLDTLGLLKVDVLALGMLTALRKTLGLVAQRLGRDFALQDIPAEDSETYDMICRADTVGVFQIESRAQMSMLPRLRPRCFYDLVVEVAIVRPGPIQGGMVHPYLRRRQGVEPVTYPSEALRTALGRTLGVPVFQEQVMQVAMLAAGFSAGQADGLRRSMAAWRRRGGVERYYEPIIEGMSARGYSREFAESIFEQIKGFSEYGFPESHAASFALLVYASCWLKHHYPAEFLAAMLNSQPLGFYTPSQLIQDAQRHEVEVLPVDVSFSELDSTMVPVGPRFGVRLGLRQIVGLRHAAAERIVLERAQAPWSDVDDLALRCDLSASEVQRLASADALRSLAGHRRQQVWSAAAVRPALPLLRDAGVHEAAFAGEAASEAEEVVWDFAALGLTLRRHPLALLRPQLAARRLQTAAALNDLPDGRLVRCAGLVTLRQQPPTANGVTFISLEDETGVLQVVCWKRLRQRQRDTLLQARLLAVYGRWQRVDAVRSVIAMHLVDLTPLLQTLMPSRAEPGSAQLNPSKRHSYSTL